MPNIIKSYWWEGNDFLIETDDGIYRLVNAYVSSVKYGALDCEPTDSVTMVENNKFWPEPSCGSTVK